MYNEYANGLRRTVHGSGKSVKYNGQLTADGKSAKYNGQLVANGLRRWKIGEKAADGKSAFVNYSIRLDN